jgi:hypothetical protein
VQAESQTTGAPGQAPPRQDREVIQNDRKPPLRMTDPIKKAASDFLLKPLKLQTNQ